MKPLKLKTILLPAMAAMLSASCGSNKSAEQQAAVTAPAPVAYFHADAATAGTLHGRVMYHGPRPTRQVVSMESDPACAKAAHGKKIYDDQLLLSNDGGVGNVFVYIKAGLEDKKFETPAESVVLDQSGCSFGPRVMGAQSKQVVLIRNSDPVEHNVHPMPKNNAAWNEGMEPGGPEMKHRFARPEIMIRIKCNVHGWMRAYLGVLDHPYFAVTGPDGSFDLKNVPPGNYMIGIWHEKLGELAQPVTIAPSAAQTLNFQFDEKSAVAPLVN